ncbi:MAG TPA: glycosyltransferase family A protein [Bacteroidales bacterium]|nr:glycosyltransferase family A protein [Bacteroidales bacterium]
MGFASGYLDKGALFPALISELPDEKTGIIIVVPAYDEPGITKLLDSLKKCERPGCPVEIMIVINAPQGASQTSLANNRLTAENIESWKMQNNDCFFRLFYISVEPVIRRWGVGLARKTGMDEAARRFDAIDNPEGVILNLDADCTVEPSYMKSVEEQLYRRKDRSACSIYFEHPLSGDDLPSVFYDYITLYELHLRFYYQALAYTGFPWVYHTVGSAMAVKAVEYIRAGGMNRRQAGEDFYFIQKLVPSDGYFYLNNTSIYPSARSSCRVPFGTGATMARMNAEKEAALLSYNFRAFTDLKFLFTLSTEIFAVKEEKELASLYRELPESIRLFTTEGEWTDRLIEIKGNTSGPASFRKRFFGWFNMFRVVKFLNQAHITSYEKVDITVSAFEYLRETGQILQFSNTKDILGYYRRMERGS